MVCCDDAIKNLQRAPDRPCGQSDRRAEVLVRHPPPPVAIMLDTIRPSRLAAESDMRQHDRSVTAVLIDFIGYHPNELGLRD
jgi:hypothetical protein